MTDVPPGADDPDPTPAEPGAPAPEGEMPDGSVQDAIDEVFATGELSVESLLDDVERLTAERDQLLDRLARAQAEFENSRRRVQRDADDRAESVAARLVEDLLPTLDACDGALAHGEAAVEPVFAALLQSLERNGLERIDPVGEPFDPTRHEAVMHEDGEGDDGPTVAAVLRIGYGWKGRVVRAAMVKVRG